MERSESPHYMPEILLHATPTRFELTVDGPLDPVERELVYELWASLPIPHDNAVIEHGPTTRIHQSIEPPYKDLNRLVTEWQRPLWADRGFSTIGSNRAIWGGPFMAVSPALYTRISKRLKARSRWKRVRSKSKIDAALRSWQMDAAKRTYAPGGAGYEMARRSFLRSKGAPDRMSRMTSKQLRALARRRGVSSTGTVAEVQLRLHEHKRSR